MAQSHNPLPLKDGLYGTELIIFCAIFFPLATVVLVLRIWSRRIMRQPLCFNDYAVLIAWPMLAILVGVSILGVVWAGWHQEDRLKHIADIPKASFCGEIFWNISATLTKLSFLHLYTRIFPQPIFRRLCFVIMALLTTLMVGTFLLEMLVCRPITKYWTPEGPGKCENIVLSILVISVFHMCSDIIIILLPMPYVINLKISLGQKVGLVAVFSCGAMVCLINALRINAAANFDRKELVLGFSKIGFFSCLEPLLGMITTCVPLILPALRRIFGFGNFPPPRDRYNNNSFLRLHAADGDRSRIARFDDIYPLTYTAITAGRAAVDSTSKSQLDNAENTNSEIAMDPKKLIIAVRNEFSVVSS